MRRLVFRLLSLAASSLLAACAFAPRHAFVGAAFDYNLAVEESQNQMLLLNVVRASKRHPMYFTAISALRGNITSSAGFGDSSIPVGGGSASAGTIAPNASVSANPSFDLAVLDSKSFTRGILTPAPLDTFRYYWDQGWPRELLLHLFIASIKEDGKAPLFNAPHLGRKDGKEAGEIDPLYLAFVARLESLFCRGGTCDLIFQEDDDVSDVAPFKAVTVKDAVAVDKAEMRFIDLGNGTMKLAAKKKDVKLRGHGVVCTAKSKDTACKIRVELRSPEAMLYYLGEILRLPPGLRPQVRACPGEPDRRADIFQADKDPPSGRQNVVSVRYMGETFAIAEAAGAACDQPRSMHALSLVGQLIGQLKENADLPATGAVTVVGGGAR